MAWSKLKTRWRELLAPAVARRVDAHMAGYRRAYEQRGRAWLTVDGKIVASFCEFAFENAWRKAGWRDNPGGSPWTSSAEYEIRAAGFNNKLDLLHAMSTCIGSSVHKSIESSDPVVRALTMLDRRLGKRRLAKIDVTAEPELVVRMYRLRCEAEGLSLRDETGDI
jgi:hypothetical protein